MNWWDEKLDYHYLNNIPFFWENESYRSTFNIEIIIYVHNLNKSTLNDGMHIFMWWDVIIYADISLKIKGKGKKKNKNKNRINQTTSNGYVFRNFLPLPKKIQKCKQKWTLNLLNAWNSNPRRKRYKKKNR